MNDAVLLYRSFFDAADDLGPEEAARFIYALGRYALDGAEPDFTGSAKMAFKLARPIIDANVKRRGDAQSGGRPAKQENKPVDKTSGKNQWIKPKEKGKDKDKVKDKGEGEYVNAREPERVISSGLDIPNPEPPAPISDKAKSFAEWFIKAHDPRPQVETSAKAMRHIKSYEELISLGYSNGDIVRAIAYSMGGECYYQNRPRTFKVHPIWSKAVRSPAHLLEADATGTRKLDRVLAALAAEDKNDIPNSDWAY